LFESLQPMPADAILGLIVEHRNDPRTEKIDLGVGVYRNADGQTPVLDTVKKAETQLLETQTSKTYIGGRSPGYDSDARWFRVTACCSWNHFASQKKSDYMG